MSRGMEEENKMEKVEIDVEEIGKYGVHLSGGFSMRRPSISHLGGYPSVRLPATQSIAYATPTPTLSDCRSYTIRRLVVYVLLTVCVPVTGLLVRVCICAYVSEYVSVCVDSARVR